MKDSPSARSLPAFALAACAFAAAAIATALWAMPAAAQDAAAQDAALEGAPGFRLADVKWKNRVLLLFAPAADAPGAQQQRRRFRAAPDSAFAERDLLLVQAPATGRGQWRGWGGEAAAPSPVSATTVARLREQFGVAADAFVLILIGKDGTEKRRDEAPVSPRAIFDEVDAMPMRQREMRRSRKGHL